MRTQYYVVLVEKPGFKGSRLYGSVSEEAYQRLRTTLANTGGLAMQPDGLLRLVAGISKPIGSNIDRFILVNGDRHPADPLAYDVSDVRSSK